MVPIKLLLEPALTGIIAFFSDSTQLQKPFADAFIQKLLSLYPHILV